ncbi:Ig-like domain-containing protein [Flavobacterium sp.]|uniref:Ig-like domain-containing protein n=1 Tax=Flavobacterium sp. TaxID=239 RepID=UPI0037528C6B
MQIKHLKYIFIVFAIALIGCAKRGTISGGAKDTLAPILVSSFPKNGSVNFKAKEIRLNFDEYVKLKNVAKQLIVSPPMKKAPEVLPYNASKYITIKLKDSLLPNTTYSFNFGQSIADNNEGNTLSQFKYVFSTGSFIDSLALKATFKDALEKKTASFVSFMLYEVNEKYTDSIIYKETPRYITNSLDSLKEIKLENLKQGKYRLIAIKDNNNNNKFDPKSDKIGFINDYVTLPNDTVFVLDLFKEKTAFKVLKPSQSSGNKATIGYEGNAKKAVFEVTKSGENFPFRISKLPKKDSLQIWFKPIKNDSINIAVKNENYSQKYVLKLKDQKADTLSFSAERTGNLPFRNQFKINSTIPIEKIDNAKIKFISKDSSNVSFTTFYDEYNQQIVFDFEKQPLEKYSMKVFPGAFIDFYEKTNDTLNYKFETQNTSDYGNLRVVLEKVKRFPVIIELTDNDGKVLAKEYSDKNTVIDFNLLEPAKFILRLIYDDNNDKEWNPGSFIEQRQSEEVIYFPKEIDVRSNWDVEQPFDVGLK